MSFEPKVQHLSRLAFRWLTLSALGALWGCGGEPPPNVAIFVLDTARADAFSLHGAAPGSTPVFDRLAREGQVFTRARSVSAWTVPSHGSLFTGLYPGEHGADHGHTQLAESQITLAELLAKTHETVGFSENPHIGQGLGFAQGFGLFEETWRTQQAATDIAPTTRRALDWLARRDRSRPFFLFVNLMAPHLPYAPPEVFQQRTLSGELDGATIEKFRRFSEWDARGYMAGLFPLTSAELDLLRNLYQAEVSFADARVGEILAALAAQGELDHTLVVVLADHGENIGHHGLIEHQFALYETLLRIPFVLRLPKGVPAGAQSEAPVQLIDVLPTVLDVVGRSASSWPRVSGVSLLSSPPSARRPVLAQYARPVDQRWRFAKIAPDFNFDRFDHGLSAVVMGPWKLILSDAGTVELFNLDEDPAETRNLAQERPEVAAPMRSWLATRSGGGQPATATAPPELDAETVRALRALGYLD